MKVLVCVSGPSCAGKTTLAEYLASLAPGWMHVEASDHMRALFEAEARSDQTIAEFALLKLRADPESVARTIAAAHHDSLRGMVVSGFRALAEITAAKRLLGPPKHHLIVYIDANTRTRFLRNKFRQRDKSLMNWSSFLRQDRLQREMGLPEIQEAEGVRRITNEGTIRELLEQGRVLIDCILTRG